MFDWEDLRYFSTFAQTGSLASAAKKLGVDHATVARRIASLEASVNLKLVDRRPRAYILTEDGRQVALYGEKMSESAYSLERFSGAEQNAVEGDVIIAAPPAFSGTLIAPHIGSFCKKFPLMRLQLTGTKERLCHAGVALLPDYLAREYHLVQAEPGGPVLTQDIWLSVHEDIRYARRISTVVDFLVSCIEPVYGL